MLTGRHPLRRRLEIEVTPKSYRRRGHLRCGVWEDCGLSASGRGGLSGHETGFRPLLHCRFHSFG